MLALAVDVFKKRISKVEKWPREEIAEYETYFALKDKREKEREANTTGSGQGRRTPGRATRGRRR